MAQIPDQQFWPPGSKASKSGDGHHKSMSRLSEQQWPNWQADFTGNVLMYFDFSENRLPYYPTPRNALSVGWLVTFFTPI